MTDSARAILQLTRASGNAGPQRLALLAAIGQHGSISAAAREAGISYKGAWDAVQALNNLFERPLVEAQPGGRAGGTARITAAGETVLAAYRAIESELAQAIERLDGVLAQGEDPAGLIWRLGLRTSARNTFRGIVRSVTPGAVNSEVELDIGGGILLVAIITGDSVADLGLAPGREALALIKSSFVILAPGAERLRTSARNCLSGTVIRHDQGAVNDEIVLDLGQGKTLTATVTRESGDALHLGIGTSAQALIKASHIILATE
ncbi:TOBE domain-containing protein [Sphingomonas crusticola]|uniref:TOBE domain-containing protein n=1 Tax=Sphingomonas crusticola TaxID=1697973 RepID=UPI000E270113|nr:TOBE domain-containing protein [Sphingomonas crusticola]